MCVDDASDIVLLSRELLAVSIACVDLFKGAAMAFAFDGYKLSELTEVKREKKRERDKEKKKGLCKIQGKWLEARLKISQFTVQATKL